MGGGKDPQLGGEKWGSSRGSDPGCAHHRSLRVQPELRRGQSLERHGLAAQGAVLSPSGVFKLLGGRTLAEPRRQNGQTQPLTTRCPEELAKRGICKALVYSNLLSPLSFPTKSCI